MQFTKFTKLEADEIRAAALKAAEIKAEKVSAAPAATVLTKSTNYTLSADELGAPVIAVTLSAASKTVTLGAAAGSVYFVVNAGGTNAFTLKNVSGDTGTSLAAGKVALVIAAAEADASAVIALN